MNLATKNPNQLKLFVEVIPESLGNDIIEIRSTSNPNTIYRVDVVRGRCSCPSWKFQRGGVRNPCKHLLSMGITTVINPKQPVVLNDNEL